MSFQTIVHELSLGAVRVTEAAALAAARFIGRGDERAADEAASAAMHAELAGLPIDGRIVIGEGDEGEASRLWVGEAIGQGGAALDIALDPIEGVTLAAKAMPGALATMAIAPRGALMHAPDIYMEKLACGPGWPPGLLNLDVEPAQNVRALADARGVAPSEITVCVLDRPRNARVISSLREVGARVRLIGDGDIAGVIATTDPAAGVDLYMGQGGAPEGVLACAALKCVGGFFQGRLVLRTPDERARARAHGLEDLDRIYDLHELVREDALFVATGVTSGALLEGVRTEGGLSFAHSLVMNSATRTAREIRLRRRL